MGFFEEALVSAKDAANAVGKKADELAKVAKQKLSLVELKKELNEKYLEFGKLAYANAKQESPDTVAAEVAIQEIDALSDKIQTVVESLKKPPNPYVCSQCVFVNPKGFRFCGKCGASLEIEEE